MAVNWRIKNNCLNRFMLKARIARNERAKSPQSVQF